MNSLRSLISTRHVLLGAAALWVAFASWQTARLAVENLKLEAKIAVPLDQTSPAAFVPGNPDPQEVASTRAELEAERRRLRIADSKIQELAAALAIEPEEELKSYGRIEVLARQGVEVLQGMAAVPELQKIAATKPDDPDSEAAMLKLMTSTMTLDVLGKLEARPAEIAELQAHALRELLQLDESTARDVRQALTREFTSVCEQGLDRPHRPAEEQEAWYVRRDRALAEAALRVEALIPVSQRKPHAVGQVLHLGSGMRSRPTGTGEHRGILLYYEVPGLEPLRY